MYRIVQTIGKIKLGGAKLGFKNSEYAPSVGICEINCDKALLENPIASGINMLMSNFLISFTEIIKLYHPLKYTL